MQSIQLQYPDGSEKNYLAPSKFEELSEEQFLKSVKIMKATESRPELQWVLLPLLMKMPLSEAEKLNEAQRVQLLFSLGFLFDPEQLPYKCMLPKITTKAVIAKPLYGPGDALKNLTFGEFMMAETKLEGYESQQGNPTLLDQFCGVLYRPTDSSRKKQSDKRVQYNEGQVEYFGKFFQQVDAHVKAAIVLNYDGAKSFLPKLYKNVFPADLQSQDNAQVKKKKSSARAWLDTLVNMADRDVTKLHSLETTSLHTVLKVLDDTIAHSQEMKREMEKARNK